MEEVMKGKEIFDANNNNGNAGRLENTSGKTELTNIVPGQQEKEEGRNENDSRINKAGVLGEYQKLGYALVNEEASVTEAKSTNLTPQDAMLTSQNANAIATTLLITNTTTTNETRDVTTSSNGRTNEGITVEVEQKNIPFPETKSGTSDEIPDVAKTYKRLLSEKPIVTAPPNFKVNENEFHNVQSKINKLEDLGVIAAYENALLLVAKKGPMPNEVREFIAKENELFGRRWNSGVTSKSRYKLSPSNKKKQIYSHHKSFVEIKRGEAIKLAEETRLRALEEARLAKLAYERAERIRKKRERTASTHIQRIARGKLSRNYVNKIRKEREIERQHIIGQCMGCIDNIINTLYEVESVVENIIVTLEEQQKREIKVKAAAAAAEAAKKKDEEDQAKLEVQHNGDEKTSKIDDDNEELKEENQEEQHIAATKLQALQRGKQARKNFVEKKKQRAKKKIPSPPKKKKSPRKSISPRDKKTNAQAKQPPPPPPKN
jgi:hypothetical protein